MQIPFFNALSDSQVVLLAGAGGGYDIASGIPLYLYLRRLGKQVILANLSFSALSLTDSREICPGAYLVNTQSRDVPYFPERHIIEWLQMRGEQPLMYGFSNELGVVPLNHAYSTLIELHAVDTLLLVDGGTDSLMFGDESGVGTIVEDACSIIAASKAGLERSYLTAVGFGVEQFHNLNHHSCLENIATLIRDNTYLGAVSLTRDMPEGADYIKLVEYLNQRSTYHMSIVSNSVSSAIQGKFGDYHVSSRTKNSEQFINPLMGLHWFFRLQGLAEHIAFTSYVERSETMNEVAKGFQLFRASTMRRAPGKIPL